MGNRPHLGNFATSFAVMSMAGNLIFTASGTSSFWWRLQLSGRFAGGLGARPLKSRPKRDDGIIWFVTDLHSAKEYEIESEERVGLPLIDAKSNAYLSITARAEVWRDHVRPPKSGSLPTTCGGKVPAIQTCACCASVR